MLRVLGSPKRLCDSLTRRDLLWAGGLGLLGLVERPISPKDILTRTYHLLGIDPETTLTDRTGRPMRLVGEGSVVSEIITR